MEIIGIYMMFFFHFVFQTNGAHRIAYTLSAATSTILRIAESKIIAAPSFLHLPSVLKQQYYI